MVEVGSRLCITTVCAVSSAWNPMEKCHPWMNPKGPKFKSRLPPIRSLQVSKKSALGPEKGCTGGEALRISACCALPISDWGHPRALTTKPPSVLVFPSFKGQSRAMCPTLRHSKHLSFSFLGLCVFSRVDSLSLRRAHVLNHVSSVLWILRPK